MNKKWLEWEEKGDERKLQKTSLKTNCTFIGLGTEHTDEYESLTFSGNQHIIYTDKESIPDMTPMLGTQLLYQLQGESNEIFAGK